MLHRDLKPSNVFVDRRNLCRLGDYGIASFASDAGSVRGVLGTPLYLAPELIEGRVCNEMADMWALGVVLYVLLQGEHPFDDAGTADNAKLKLNIRTKKPSFDSWSGSAESRKLVSRVAANHFFRPVFIANFFNLS